MNDLFNIILENELTPNGLYVLYCTKNKIRCPLKNTAGEMYILQANGWLGQKNELTIKAKEVLSNCTLLFDKKSKEVQHFVLGKDADQRIEEFRQLFPPGAPAKHGVPVRTIGHELLPKFVWFFKTFPQFDWDMVMAATRYYIQDQAMQNNTYLSQAKFFIQKQDNSQPGQFKSPLATYCDDLELKDKAA